MQNKTGAASKKKVKITLLNSGVSCLPAHMAIAETRLETFY
jgi:hypothetical protein